ncbi:hypothetical protein HDV02_004069 [Globomyces sp. JEL0801]|nr:hypothetical protein HDV02_004069 [Globomyces sp. JEL0801]
MYNTFLFPSYENSQTHQVDDIDRSIEGEFDDEETSINEINIDDNQVIYPPLAINPTTGRKYTVKEKNQALRDLIETRLEEEPMQKNSPFVFTGATPGPTDQEITAFQIFEKFICNNIFILVVESSNEYAKSDRFIKRKKRDKPGDPLTIREFYLWCATMLLCSVHGKTDVQANWLKMFI